MYLCSSLGGVVFSGFKRPSERQSDMWKRRQGLQTWFLDCALPFGLGIRHSLESFTSCAPDHTLHRVEANQDQVIEYSIFNGVSKNGDVIYIRFQSAYYQFEISISSINFLVSRSDETLILLTLSRPPRACADRNEIFLDASLIGTHPPGTSARSSLSAKHFEVANTRVCHYHFPVSKHRTSISTTIRV